MAETDAEKLQRLWNETNASKAETKEEWAARTARTLTERGWREAEHIARSGNRKSGLVEIETGDQRVSPAQARAILDYRERVAESLVDCERDVLCGNDRWGAAASLAAAEVLRSRGLHAWHRHAYGLLSGATPFGREVARVLEGSHE